MIWYRECARTIKNASRMARRLVTTRSGFTFVEVLVVLLIIGVAFVPLMQMYAKAMEQVSYLSEMRIAIDLAREEMEKVKNLSLTMEQIKYIGNVMSPPLSIANARWRTARVIDPASDPLLIDIYVFREPDTSRPLMRLTTKMSKG